MTSLLEQRQIGFIGCGAMARALCKGLISAGVPIANLRGADLDAAQRASFEDELGVRTTSDNTQLVADSEIVVLCVKPGVVAGVLGDLSADAIPAQKLWISIAAGVRIASLEATLGPGSRIVRVMPNTPALVGEGASVSCANSQATAEDRAAVEALFGAVGTIWEAPAEQMLDAVTGLSGSGPAYVFLFLEALGDAGVRQGLPRDVAYKLAFQTVLGAARLAIESGRHPAELKDQVTSPGGTTIAGLAALDEGGFREVLARAVAAATRRSVELGEDS